MKQKTEVIQEDKLDELLTVKDVMDKLKFSRQKIYMLTRDGDLRSYKIGKSVRYKMTDVQKLIQPPQNVAA